MPVRHWSLVSNADMLGGPQVEAQVGKASSLAPRAHQALTLGSDPSLIRSIMADHK